MNRQCCDRLIARRVNDPAFEIHSSPGIHQRINCLLLVVQIFDANGVGRITRKPRNRRFIINDTNRRPAPAKTSRNAEPLEIAADDNPPNSLFRQINIWNHNSGLIGV